jgi:23S rRNA (cytidine1920-2'-O)/16S rRNA (cytidine1409-2'-O)-methyltransferase
MPSRRIPLIELLRIAYPSKPDNELLALIMRGDVRVDGEAAEKPGARVDSRSRISLRERSPYVSRGGEKLAHALETWKVDCASTVWLDAGCSTGGFTDCLLARGASFVHAVDVGTNQLDWRIRTDARVLVREGTNVMDLRAGDLDPPPQRAVADLSFRSLRRAASHILGLTDEGWGIFLVKPQFEWARPSREFRGVVRDPGTMVSIARELVEALASEELSLEKAVLSPIRGRKGNRELLFLLRAGKERAGDIFLQDIEKIILDGWGEQV